MFDTNPNILAWSSESVGIKYLHPFKLAQGHSNPVATYYPDYLIVYIDKNGKQHKEMIEVKPFKQTVMEAAKGKKDKEAVILNTAKWEAARAYCRNVGLKFRIITEKDIFAGKK